jgi:cell fate (sporulation/competence/biofilm development) regulator YmcA (YheA/YmcA/DUF963 family)
MDAQHRQLESLRNIRLNAIGIPAKERIGTLAVKAYEGKNKVQIIGGFIRIKPASTQFKQKLKDASEFIEKLLGKTGYKNHAITANEVRVSAKGSRAMSISRGFITKIGNINITGHKPLTTYIHELGHQIEDNLKEGRKLAAEFQKYRVAKAGTKTEKLKDVFPKSGYDEFEKGNPDGFRTVMTKSDAYYAGKTYSDGSTELTSMGLELLYNNPEHFAKHDPEFFNFITGLLSGVL